MWRVGSSLMFMSFPTRIALGVIDVVYHLSDRNRSLWVSLFEQELVDHAR